jgi:flagellar basal body-associated protein FliL
VVHRNQRFLLVWIAIAIIVTMCVLGANSVIDGRNSAAALRASNAQSYPTPVPYFAPGHYYP